MDIPGVAGDVPDEKKDVPDRTVDVPGAAKHGENRGIIGVLGGKANDLLGIIKSGVAESSFCTTEKLLKTR